MALASNCKFVSSITSKVFQNVKYICLQKLATDSTQLTSTGKSTPPKEQKKDVAGLSASVYTTPSHDPNHEASPDPNTPSSVAEHENASPDPNSPSSVAEHENVSPDPNSPSIAEYENENSKITEKSVNDAGDLNNVALQNASRHNTNFTPPDNQKFVAGRLPQNIVDSFNSEPDANLNKVSPTLPVAHDNKLLLMSVEMGIMPESVQLLCSDLTPCKPISKIKTKVNDADSIKNLITNVEDQCKLLNGVCENDYNKLLLIALELGSIPQGLQTFFKEHFFINKSKTKENELLSKEFTQFTENLAAGEKFNGGVTSILSLLYGSVPRIFDEYLNMSNNVSDIIQRTTSQDQQHLRNEAQKRDIFENTPSSAQSLHEEDTRPVDKVSANENHSSTFTNFYANTVDIIDSIGDEFDVGPLESFPIKNNRTSELSRDMIKASGVFGMNSSRGMMQVGDPNLEISPKMTNPAPTSPYSNLKEENVGQPSSSIQPEETCKHCLLSAQHDPGVVKEVPILSQPHIDKFIPPLTEFKKSSTDLAESKLKNVKKSVPEEMSHTSNIENMKLNHLIVELGIVSKRTIMHCSKLSSSPPRKLSTFLEQHKSTKKCCCYNLFMVMLETGILPVGIERDTVTFTDIQDSTFQHLEKYCKSAEVTKDKLRSVNYAHKPEPMKIKRALIPWKSTPNALTVRPKEISLVPVAVKPINVNISDFVKSKAEDFLQKEKRKDLYIFEIPIHNEKSTEILTVEHDAFVCDPKNDKLYNEVYGVNTSIAVPRDDVQQDNVNNINTENSDKLPISEPVLSRKQEVIVLNYWEMVDNIKSQKGPHISHVKVKDEQIQAHQPQETVIVSQRETVTLNKLKMQAGSEINNTSEYIHFVSYIIKNPGKEVQEKIEFKLSAKSDDVTVPLKHNVTEKVSPTVSPNPTVKEKELTIVSPNQTVKEKELPIVSPNKTVMLPALHTNDTLAISCVRKEKVTKFAVSPEQLAPILDTNDTLSVSYSIEKEEANNKTFVDSPKKTVTSPALDTSDTLSVFYNLRNEKFNNKTFVVSPEKTVMPPVLDNNDTLSGSSNIGKEKANQTFVDSPKKTVTSPVLDTSDTLSVFYNLRNEKFNNKTLVVSPEKTVKPPVLDDNDTLSGSCNVGKERTNMKFAVSSDQLPPKLDTVTQSFHCIVGNDKAYNKTLVVSPEKAVMAPALDTNDTLSCNIEKEKINILDFVVAPEQTVMPTVFDTENIPSIFCNIGKEKANNKTLVSPEISVTAPALDTNDTLSSNLGKEKINIQDFVVAPEQTVMPTVFDTKNIPSIFCNIGKEKVNNKTLVSPEISVTAPALDTNNTLSSNFGKEKINNQNLVVAPEKTVMSPILDTKDTLSISCNVDKEKVKNLVSDENVESMSGKNIVSVFYSNLCISSKNLESNKPTHVNKQDTESSNKSHNADECLKFIDKAQRSIRAIVKAVTDKYNYSVNKFSANYTSKSDDCPPTELETSYFHMGDIFRNIWKPFILNIWKVFDYLNNFNLHNGLTNLALKRDLPQKLESCDLEVSNKLNSSFLLTQIKDDNVFRISKYKYFSELCPETFAIYPKFKLKSNLKEDVKQHIQKCSTEVCGPSSSVFVECNGEVGPGASKSGEYKNPEYFSYHKESYFEAEVEMLKYRLPQPSSQEK